MSGSPPIPAPAAHPAPAPPYHVARDLYLELPADDTHLAISKMDWNRVKRMVDECPVDTRVTQIVYSVLFAIAVSAGLTIIPIKATTNLPAWVLPFYILTTVFSFAIAIVFVILDKKYGDVTTGHLDLVKKDMTEIEATFPRATPAPQ